jgi:excisionase family DNA binding protein
MTNQKVLRAHVYLPPAFSEDRNVLTVAEVARELRCSKAHVHNIINGRVPHVPPLPVLRIGRRVLIRHDGLKTWMLSIEARASGTQEPTVPFGAKGNT